MHRLAVTITAIVIVVALFFAFGVAIANVGGAVHHP